MSTVLLIGKRAKVLEPLADSLRKDNHTVLLTNDFTNLDNLPTIAVDVVAFGRALTKEQKGAIEKRYLKNNPKLAFVHGRAPITELLNAQINAAITAQQNSSRVSGLSYDRSSHQLEIDLSRPSDVRIEAWWLTWLYGSKHLLLLPKTALPKGRQSVTVGKVPTSASLIIRVANETYVI